MLALLWLAAKSLLLLAGLLLPGAAIMRALRLPQTIATCFAGSAVALYATVLALQFASIRISLGSLVAGLAIVAMVAFALSRFRPDASERTMRSGVPTGRTDAPHPPRGWLLLYAVFWIAVLWRAWHEPLAGPDIGFRWSFLAEQMLRIGSLDFYPPRAAHDFLSYFWVESIPPGVSALHAWAYACAGGAKAAWTVPGVVLQLVSLHELLWRTATNIAGARAGKLACLAATACPLLTWSVLLGQETGLTALSAVGIVFALEAWRRTRSAEWAAVVGIFAMLGAMAREYGLVFPVLAAAGLAVVRADRRAWLAFLATLPLALAWPVRTWLLTDNPFYSLAFAGLPTNARFIAWIEHDAAALGAPLHSVSGWLGVGRYLVLFATTGFAGWLVLGTAAVRRSRDAVCLLVAIVTLLALWAASVRYTNGGLFYSLRVASPALALGVLALGAGLTRWSRGVWPLLLILALTLPATLALPLNPFRTPWHEWPSFARPVSENDDDILALVLRSRAPGTVLTDSPGFQRTFLPAGIPVIPLWSPQVDWLFDRSLSSAESVRRWRKSGVRHVIVAKWQTNLDFFNRHTRWNSPPFHVRLVGETATAAVFALTADN